MATYFIADVHAHYNLFVKLLEKINYSSTDKMIILGDIIDKGDNSIKMIKFVRNHSNIQMILGNHEYYFLNEYHNLMKNFNDGEDIDLVLEKLQRYFPSESEKLDWDDIDYIDNLPYYIETDKYICVHAGVEIDLNNNIKLLEKTDINYFLFDRTLKSSSFIPKIDKTILFGHTPCYYENGTKKFIKTPRQEKLNPQKLEDYAKIQLDLGVYITNTLGTLRLEDMQEFYVKEE